MKSKVTVVVSVLLVVAAMIFYSSIFVLDEGTQAVVTQFGRPVRFVTDAGLHYKTPMVQEIHRLEKRTLPWDGAAESMQTRDKKRIFIDVWARWKIDDPEKFFRAVRTEQRGQKILDDLVDSSVRNIVARNKLIDVVRSTNDKLTYEDDKVRELARNSDSTADVVTSGRSEMEKLILQNVSADLKKNNYGMGLVAVRVKRVNYVESVKVAVYERMRSERLRIARLFESEAEEEQNKILGLTQKELDEIEGDMKQETAGIMGEADAEVIRLTAEAYDQSPSFFEFLRRLEVYKTALGDDTRLILTTNSEVFRLLKELPNVVPSHRALTPIPEAGATPARKP